ncbi:DUF4097 family beta strand repeat-containing protein [Adhaeribacter radiodurans]|uniref:DUF4097 family beta strand repeat protein n=1 Tax=Adhaeribacter radiodurans TaxID=2745197 RepID=A0A7L7LEP2_9BACT|nr:hypothetical protein [Adhaeribacter radiodurans]QMU31227.1 hypothetical protein HUW48_25775 [Adhaeribacter radiodurans]
MKENITLALLGCLFTLQALAQPKIIEKTMSVPTDKKVNLRFDIGNNIKITAWDREDASIKMTYQINGGRLNNALQPTFNAENGIARIDVKFDRELLKTGRAEDCPDNQRNNYYYQDGVQAFTCQQIDYEVFVPRDAAVTVESVHCSIELRGLTGPVRAKSIHGFVDLSWPQKKGADVTLKTVHGDVFSNLAIKFPGKKDERRLMGSINGGGTSIDLETIHNNVYFRQQQ